MNRFSFVILMNDNFKSILFSVLFIVNAGKHCGETSVVYQVEHSQCAGWWWEHAFDIMTIKPIRGSQIF